MEFLSKFWSGQTSPWDSFDSVRQLIRSSQFSVLFPSKLLRTRPFFIAALLQLSDSSMGFYIFVWNSFHRDVTLKLTMVLSQLLKKFHIIVSETSRFHIILFLTINMLSQMEEVRRLVLWLCNASFTFVVKFVGNIIIYRKMWTIRSKTSK